MATDVTNGDQIAPEPVEQSTVSKVPSTGCNDTETCASDAAPAEQPATPGSVDNSEEKITDIEEANATPDAPPQHDQLEKKLLLIQRKLTVVYEELGLDEEDLEPEEVDKDEDGKASVTSNIDGPVQRRDQLCQSRLEYTTVKKYDARDFSFSERHHAIDVVTVNDEPQGGTFAAESGANAADAVKRFGQFILIQINSQALLNLLKETHPRATKVKEDQAFVMLAPFKFLCYEQDALRETLDTLHSKWSDHSQDPENQPHTATTAPGASLPELKEPNDTITNGEETGKSRPQLTSKASYRVGNKEDAIDDVSKSPPDTDAHGPTAYKDLKLLMEFFDSHVKPWWDFLRSPDVETVEFGDLCALFAPGDFVTMPDSPQRMFRVMSVVGGRPKLKQLYKGATASTSKGSAKPEGGPSRNAKDKSSKERNDWSDLTLDCYYIDHDGKQFCTVMKKFYIDPYFAPKSVKKLRPYPLRFADSKLRDDCYREGVRFLEITDPKNKPALFRYEGRTLTNRADGTRLGRSGKTYDSGDMPTSDYLSQEDVDAQVVIDFDTTFLYNSGWAPLTPFVADNTPPDDDEDDTRDLQIGAALTRSCIHVECFHFLDLQRTDEFFNEDHWLSNRRLQDEEEDKERRKLFQSPHGNLTDDVLILPNRVFGYILRNRTWSCFDLSTKANWRRVNNNAKSWRELQIKDSHRSTLASLVTRHFRNRSAVTRARAGERVDNFDFIEGKGKGLIILLHGAPGVGKTSTAESIASLYGKPLLPITCGNLGTDARMVEQALQENFRLAENWGCIVLLDEADVFLARREKNDLQRNALVSVFLRMLEYYTGVLFLTTNRTGDFDEAFRSRIHVSLYYTDLGPARTLKVWEINLNRVKEQQKEKGYVVTAEGQEKIMLFAQRHWDAYSILQRTPWNGRQIRNAFQTAVALAEYKEGNIIDQMHTTHAQAAETDRHVVELTWEHFKQVAIATNLFETYLIETRGKTEEEQAADFHIRNRMYRYAAETDEQTGQVKPRKWKKISNRVAAELIESLHPDVKVTEPEGLDEDPNDTFDPFQNALKFGTRHQSFTRAPSQVASPPPMQTPIQQGNVAAQQSPFYGVGQPVGGVQMHPAPVFGIQGPVMQQGLVSQGQGSYQPYLQQHQPPGPISHQHQGQYSAMNYPQADQGQAIQQPAQNTVQYQQPYVQNGLPANPGMPLSMTPPVHSQPMQTQPMQSQAMQPQPMQVMQSQAQNLQDQTHPGLPIHPSGNQPIPQTVQ